jgi:hypothetical protein
MKFLCLAYGNEEHWNEIPKEEQDALLAQDEAIRRRGDLVASVDKAITVRIVSGRVTSVRGSFANPRAPLVGFYLIEAATLEEAIDLVSKTPCPRTKGVVEVWPVV